MRRSACATAMARGWTRSPDGDERSIDVVGYAMMENVEEADDGIASGMLV